MSDAPPASSSAFAPLSQPIFRAVWLASLLSSFGGLIQSVGASWMMTSLTSSANLVALVQAAATLPIMALALVAGAVADSLDRRCVMLAAQVFMLSVSVLLAVVAWAGLVTPWLLLLFTFLLGCGTAMNGPAWQASVGDMVPRSDLPAAVALNSMGFNAARSVGPAVGGAIVAAGGVAAAFAVNAMSYVALITVLARWNPVHVPTSLPRESLGAAMRAGVRYVAMSPRMLAVLLRGCVFGFGAVAVTALMPLIARESVGGGPLTYGLILGAFGVGAVAGALGSARIRAMAPTETIVRGASLIFAAASVVAGLSTSLPLTLAALFPAGAAWVLALSSFNVTVQMSSPRWVVARALSLYQMATFGGMAAGAWLWGRVAEEAGLSQTLVVAAGVLVGCALLGLVLPLADAGRRDLDPRGLWTAPETAVPVDARTGPVVVAVEWRVAEADLPEFLHAMGERRRIRRRDGAHDWHLLRDLADPELWIERYRTATWLDYVRLNSRLTRDDGELWDRLRTFNQGGGRPVVRRMIERPPVPLTHDAAEAARDLAAPLADPTRTA